MHYFRARLLISVCRGLGVLSTGSKMEFILKYVSETLLHQFKGNKAFGNVNFIHTKNYDPYN